MTAEVLPKTGILSEPIQYSTRFAQQGNGALNFPQMKDYDGFFPFINIMKVGVWGWTGDRYETTNPVAPGGGATPINNNGTHNCDANNDILNLVAGGDTICFILSSLVAPIAIKTGEYVLTWEGTGATVILGGYTSFISNIQTSPNRITFDMSQLPANDYITPSPESLHIEIFNGTASTIPFLRNFKLFHSSHEPLLNAGEIFNPDYISQIGHPNRIRFMKNTWVERGRDIATLGTESNRTYQAPYAEANTPTSYPFPPSVMAELGAKLGCDIQVCCPYTVNDSFLVAMAAQIKSVSTFTGKVHAEAGNEGWNNSYYENQTDLANIATTNSLIVPTGGFGAMAAEAWVALRWWKALESSLGRNRVIRQLSSQCAGGLTTDNWGEVMLRFVDPGIITSGALVKILIDEYQVAPYCRLEDSSFIGYSSAALKNLAISQISDSAFTAMYSNGSADTAVQVAAIRSGLTAIRSSPPITLTSYEWGHETDVGVGFTFIYCFSIINGHGLFNMNNPAALTPVYLDGDVVTLFKDLGTNTYFPITTADYNSKYYIKQKSNTDEFWLFASDAARLADTGNTGVGAVVLDDIHNRTDYTLDNLSAAARLALNMQAFWDDTAGRDMYIIHYNNTIGQNLCQAPCQFYDIGGYNSDTAWGLKSSIYSPDTPRSVWFRSL